MPRLRRRVAERLDCDSRPILNGPTLTPESTAALDQYHSSDRKQVSRLTGLSLGRGMILESVKQK
jgi:hypothetical protein